MVRHGGEQHARREVQRRGLCGGEGRARGGEARALGAALRERGGGGAALGALVRLLRYVYWHLPRVWGKQTS